MVLHHQMPIEVSANSLVDLSHSGNHKKSLNKNLVKVEEVKFIFIATYNFRKDATMKKQMTVTQFKK